MFKKPDNHELKIGSFVWHCMLLDDYLGFGEVIGITHNKFHNKPIYIKFGGLSMALIRIALTMI